jgi:hypothetical protein
MLFLFLIVLEVAFLGSIGAALYAAIAWRGR